VLGSGDAAIEAALQQAFASHGDHAALRLGYDEALAHRLVAGGDVLLMPSRFEPCGLTQLYALRYGTLPLVHEVGGLADTVTDCALENLDDGSASGFVFHSFAAAGLQAGVRRAFALRRRAPEWAAVQRHAMQLRFEWAHAAHHYLELFSRFTHAGSA
jgi:starch synthase